MIDRERPGYPRLVLAMLLVVYAFNFLDRQILGILAQPIQAELKLDDAQFGLIGGPPFAILYSILGVPFALLADRVGKARVIATALIVWSGFTALCGMAGSFWSLFAYRMGVGVGEAGGVAPSYALIADYYPIERRARALGIYSMGIPIGLAVGVLAGAYIATLVNWRVAFFTVGIAGIVIAPFFMWIVHDRAKPATPAPAAQRVALWAVFPILAAKPAFWLMAFAAGCSSLAGYGLALWVPKILMTRFDWSLITAGQFMGSLLLTGGAGGVFLGGVLADRLGRADRLGDHSADLHARAADAVAGAGVVLPVDPQCAQHPVARPAQHRGATPRPAADARQRLGDLPADQQPRRARPRAVVARHDVGRAQGAIWRGFAALCRDHRRRLLPRGGGARGVRRPRGAARLDRGTSRRLTFARRGEFHLGVAIGDIAHFPRALGEEHRVAVAILGQRAAVDIGEILERRGIVG